MPYGLHVTVTAIDPFKISDVMLAEGKYDTK